MNLLIIANIRKDQGGITTQILELTRSLSGEGINTILISTHGKIKDRLLSIHRAIKASNNVDCILGVGCAYWGFIPIVIAWFVSKYRKKKVIYNFHDGQVEEFLKKYSGIFKLIVGKNIVITANDYLKEVLIEYGINSIRINNHLNDIKAEPIYKKNDDDFKILWARNFEKLYHPEIALEAAKVVVKENKNISFHFYGRGSMLNEMKNIYSNIERINFYDFVKRDELIEIYKKYDIFINTTEVDNFPMSIVEAGAKGLIVITSRAKGIEYLYNGNEVIYFNNVIELVSLIESTINQYNSFTNLRLNLQKKVMTFNWENVRNKWLKVIND